MIAFSCLSCTIFIHYHLMVLLHAISISRIFGQKVAEMPLVATRIQYRRHGMCRVLMDELEKVS